VFANAEARQMIGCSEGDWVERPMEEVLWGLFPGTAEPQTLLTGTRRGSPFHATIPSKCGRLLPVEGTYSITDGEEREAVIIAHPGGRERAPRSRLMEDVLACLPAAVAIEHGGHVLYTNPAFGRIFGYSAEESCGGSLCELIVPEPRLEEHKMLGRSARENGRAAVETTRRNKAGETLDVHVELAPLLVNGSAAGWVYTFRELGEGAKSAAEPTQAGTHDTLTGLASRGLFLERLHLAMSRRVRHPERTCGLVSIDIDGLKEINDALGHAAGDVILKAAAERLESALRPQDSAARLGGDDFAVVVNEIATTADLEKVAVRLSREMARPFEIFGHFVKAGASIGAAIAGPQHTAPAQLIRDAELALYRARQAGGGRYEIFNKHLEVCVLSHQERERELRAILDKRQFEFRFQPIYRLETGQLEGFELLLCRRKSDGSVEDFRDLLAVAEDTGLSIALIRETLDAACTRLREWQNRLAQTSPAMKKLTLTVNVTHRQLYHSDLAAQLRQALEASGADPAQLWIEAPESALNENPEAAALILTRLSDCGVRIAMDRFGGALAPLNHLVRLPIRRVKLDPKLTVTVASTGRELTMLESLVRLALALDLEVAAQGVENPEQVAALAQMGCALGQGPLLSSALGAEQSLQLAESMADSTTAA
jgi:Amt family ammonium transporter